MNTMKVGLTIFCSWLIAAIVCVAGWVTHVVTCIQNETWILLVVGALVAPVGAIHGIGVWFGAW